MVFPVAIEVEVYRATGAVLIVVVDPIVAVDVAVDIVFPGRLLLLLRLLKILKPLL